MQAVLSLMEFSIGAVFCPADCWRLKKTGEGGEAQVMRKVLAEYE